MHTVPSGQGWLPPGYEAVRALGAGGMGEVWLATSPAGEIRAVKRMKLTAEGGADRLRFKREFIAISKVKHPGIIVAHELFETPGNILYTMDFVEGWPLKEYFSAGHWNGGGCATPDYFRTQAGVDKVFAAAELILEILAGLHRHQMIHRDLKSANLIARPDGAITLIDFGLARGEEEDFSITSAGEIMGTPLYISPEQIQGQPLDGRCDLYTLGAMLYELTTGAPPFQDKAIAALLMAHLQRPPVPPLRSNPLITAMQSDFLLRLLAKSPAGRFPSAAAALAAWRQSDTAPEDIDRSRETSALHHLPAAVGHGVLLVAPFSGNPGAAQSVRDACEELQQGSGGTLLVSGPAGFGKSKLNDEARAAAANLGLSVWQGSGRAAGGQIGQIFHDIFTQVAAELERRPALVAPWLKEDGAVLAHHFPALRILPGLENPQLPELEPAGVRARIMAAVYGFFKRQTGKRRIIIAEDLHWADELSLDLLDHLIHNFTGGGGDGGADAENRILVLANYRPDEVESPPALGKWLAARREPNIQRISLKPLDPAALETLAQAALGEPRPLGDSVLLRLHELTGGNPYFLLELLRKGIESGGLKRDRAGDWPLADWLKSSASSALPDSIDTALAQRIAALPAALQEALPAAAIWGRECAFTDWLALTGLAEGELLDLTDIAFKAGVLIETGADKFAFPHDLLRAKIIGGISGLKLRRLHGKAVARLTADPHRAELEAAAIARHALAAGLIPEAVHWGLKGADGYHQSYQFDAAAGLLDALAPLFDEPKEKSAAAWTEFLRLQCLVQRQWGDLEASVRAGEEGLAVARTLGQAAPFGQVLVALLNTYGQRGQYAESLKLGELARAEIAALGDEALGWRIEFEVASAAFNLGLAAEAQTRLAALVGAQPRLPAAVQPKCTRLLAELRMFMAFDKGEFVEGAAQARAAMEWSERSGDLVGLAAHEGNLGEFELQLGRLDLARTLLQAALAHNLALGARNAALDNRNNLGQLEFYNDNPADARRHLQSSISAAQAAGMKSLELDARSHLANVLGSGGDFAAARELLAGAIAMARLMNSPARIAALLARLARLEIAAGHFQAATAAAGESLSLSAGKFSDSEARARCALAASGAGEHPLAQFQHALTLALSTKSVPLEFEIRVDASRALLKARQFAGALELLGDTPQRANQLGFKLFAAEAGQILAAAQKQITA